MAKKKNPAPPHKRRRNGGKKLFGEGIDPAVGKATQIQPGEVRNPAGRPKVKPILETIREIIDAKPEVARKIAENALQEAGRNLGWFTEVRDMLDGKPDGNAEGGGGGAGSVLNLSVSVTFKDAEPKG